ncbi:MAG: sll0787 family AIR synthase-like protein [Thermodesulfobacteriota bacterium]
MKDLIKTLLSSPRLSEKTQIGNIWNYFPKFASVQGKDVLLGDDAAAIENDGQYLLLAAEGVYQPLLKSDPYLAGRTSVLTNVNDIYSMGGRPVALLDVLFSSGVDELDQVLSGIYDNASRYCVPVVGGHLNSESNESALAVFILGKANKLLSSFNAKAGDDLILVTSNNGNFNDDYNFWDSSSELSKNRIIKELEILPQIAEEGLADAAKDISMAGVIGSLLMLLECSEKGAEINIDNFSTPPGVTLSDWLLTFPSYGFVLSIRPENTVNVQKKFSNLGLLCEKIGKVNADQKIYVANDKGKKELFWDLKLRSFIGMNKSDSKKVING